MASKKYNKVHSKKDYTPKAECYCKDYNKVLAFSKEHDITLAEAIKKACNGCSE